MTTTFGYVSLGGVFQGSDTFPLIAAADRFLHLGSAGPNLAVHKVDFWKPQFQNALRAEIDRVLATGTTGIFLDECDLYGTFNQAGAFLPNPRMVIPPGKTPCTAARF